MWLAESEGIHESDTEVQHLIRQVVDVRFVGQSGAGQIERQDAEMLRQVHVADIPIATWIPRSRGSR